MWYTTTQANRTQEKVWTRARVLLSTVAFATQSLCAASAEERRYDAGPLIAADFRAPVPKSLPAIGRITPLAKADSDMRFAVRYAFREQGDGVEAELTEIDIYAVFLPDSSWNSRPGDKGVMAHEQGHFDITQIYALEALANVRKQMAEGKKLIGRGEDENAAQAELEKQLRALLKPVYDRAAVAQQDYDRQTGHGTDAAAQARHRQRQIELLGELNKDLAAGP
jgi:hypothetical protein